MPWLPHSTGISSLWSVMCCFMFSTVNSLAHFSIDYSPNRLHTAIFEWLWQFTEFSIRTSHPDMSPARSFALCQLTYISAQRVCSSLSSCLSLLEVRFHTILRPSEGDFSHKNFAKEQSILRARCFESDLSSATILVLYLPSPFKFWLSLVSWPLFWLYSCKFKISTVFVWLWSVKLLVIICNWYINKNRP